MNSKQIDIDYLIQNDSDFVNRDECWDEYYQKMYGGKITPSLSAYKEKVLEILPIMLTNGTREEMNKHEVGALWEDIADGAYFRRAIATSGNISIDSQLELVEPFKGKVKFFGDLRIYFINRRFYLKNIVSRDTFEVTIPAIEFANAESNTTNLIEEIISRTKSNNVESALAWIIKKSSINLSPGRHNLYKYDVFISHRSLDYKIAEKLYDYLIAKDKNVFLSEKSLPELGSTEFMKRIDEAIEFSKHMIVVCSDTKYLFSGWVESEWRMFINEKRSERKDGNFFTLIVEPFTIDSLPIAIRQFDVFALNQENIENSLLYVN